jgi:hypothetical protein
MWAHNLLGESGIRVERSRELVVTAVSVEGTRLFVIGMVNLSALERFIYPHRFGLRDLERSY